VTECLAMNLFSDRLASAHTQAGIQVNPLAETEDGTLVAADAKLGFDDNASFRHKDLFAKRDSSQEDPRSAFALCSPQSMPEADLQDSAPALFDGSQPSTICKVNTLSLRNQDPTLAILCNIAESCPVPVRICVLGSCDYQYLPCLALRRLSEGLSGFCAASQGSGSWEV